MLDLKTEKLTYEALEERAETLEREIFEVKKAEETLRRQNEYLTALHETSLGLIDHLGKEELLEAVLQRAAMLSGTEHGYIYLLEPGEAEIQMRVGMGFFKRQLGLRVKKGQGVGGKVWESEQPLVVTDYRSWQGRLSDRSLDDLHSVVGIPLKDRQRVHGVIGLATVKPGRRFKEDDIAVLGRFAELVLVALDKAKLYADVRRELAERKRTEATLRESEQRYRLLLESSPDPVVVYNIHGRATYVNPAFEQTFGFSSDELLGKQIDFVPEENWPETKEAIVNMLSGKKIHLFETRRLTKDGRVLDVQLSSTLYYDHKGEPAGNIVTLRDISAQKKAEIELRKYHDHLEELVGERTAELAKINAQLKQEIDERKRAEKTLRKHEIELKAQSHHLEEVNTALKVLLKQREDDKKELGENVLSNVKELISPYLERLKKSRLNTDQKTLINILDSNLSNMISPFISKLSSRYFNLTPMEVRVANLVKEGKTNKEIAELLYISKNTVLFHRYNIRQKLGLKNKKINLRSHLLSYDS
ncbi:MAG: PAS domain S-box protein [Desulfobacterales bacterium]|nr:MAG: PAS domain S-box protein [Desulfobacterales bacterium]